MQHGHLYCLPHAQYVTGVSRARRRCSDRSKRSVLARARPSHHRSPTSRAGVRAKHAGGPLSGQMSQPVGRLDVGEQVARVRTGCSRSGRPDSACQRVRGVRVHARNQGVVVSTASV